MEFHLHHLSKLQEVRLKIRQHRRAVVETILIALVLLYALAVLASQVRIYIREQNNPVDLATAHYGHFYEVGQSRVYYEYYPSISASKSNLVFLHGFGSNLRSWDHQLQFFEQEYNLLLIDLPGFGLSQQVDEALINDIDQQTKLVSEVMQVVDMQSAVMVGNSYGGGLALRMALDYPDRVAGLGLIGSVDLSGRPDLSGLAFSNSPLLLQIPAGILINEDTALSILRSAYGTQLPISDEVLNVHFLAYSLNGSTANLLKYVFAPRSDRNGELSNVKVPVLVMYGLNDTWIPQEMRDSLGKLPNHEWADVPEVGHLPQQQDPIVFNQLLYKWLTNLR